MNIQVESPIPKITADLISATSAIADLAMGGLRQKCIVVQAVADSGKAVDQLTVGELVALAQKANR